MDPTFQINYVRSQPSSMFAARKFKQKLRPIFVSIFLAALYNANLIECFGPNLNLEFVENLIKI